MKKSSFLSLIAMLFVSFGLFAQSRTLAVDTIVTTHHKLNAVNGAFTYTAQTGTQPVWDENAKAVASLHYTYYTRDGIRNRDNRPLLISFNGGPGSGSVWMHLAYTGPRVLNIDDEGYPVQPYGFKENPSFFLFLIM